MRQKKDLEDINQACLSELIRHDMNQDDYDALLMRVMREKLSRAVLGRVQDLTIEELILIRDMNHKKAPVIKKK